MLIHESKLLEHLKAVKDYFFLSKGEFYRHFVECSAQLLEKVPTQRSEADINQGPFQQAAHAFGLEDDEYFKRFSLQVMMI